MQNKKKIKIFLVDDDPVYLKILEIQFLEHADLVIETFATGELCVASLVNKPDIIILDYHLDGVFLSAMNFLLQQYEKGTQLVYGTHVKMKYKILLN